jgi:hypothetical protein
MPTATVWGSKYQSRPTRWAFGTGSAQTNRASVTTSQGTSAAQNNAAGALGCMSQVFMRGLTFALSRLWRLAKPAVAGRLQRRVRPWPSNAFFGTLSDSRHARTLPEVTVQAQLPDAPFSERAPRTAESLGGTLARQGARSISAKLGGSRAPSRHDTTLHSGCGLTFEFTRLRKRAKPAVAGRVQRRVRPHASCHVMLGNCRSAYATASSSDGRLGTRLQKLPGEPAASYARKKQGVG